MRSHALPGLLDRWFAEFDDALSAPVARPFRPALDLIEYPDRYEVVADMPGVDEKNVEVEFTEGALQIRAERCSEATPQDARYFRQERPTGKFGRTVGFRDDVHVEGIEASFRDGVLRVRVPKSEKNRPRQIPVSLH